MIESQLTEILERAGEQVDVGPPPIEALRTGAARRRRRRTWAWSAVTVAAVVAVIGATTVLSRGFHGADPQPPVASGSTGEIPGGTRLVGLGHAAIAVPKNWGTNQLKCGTPTTDTVVVDFGITTLCLGLPRAGVESVEVVRGKPKPDYLADESTEIDGVPAERQRTTCSPGPINQVPVCSGTVFIPSLDVAFQAMSSTSAEEVDRILARIVIVPDLVGVPGYRTIDRNGHQLLGADYAELLKEAGLKAEFRTRKSPSYPAGMIFSGSPAPGTMVAPGTPVTITVAG
jgi:hypothetical protein